VEQGFLGGCVVLTAGKKTQACQAGLQKKNRGSSLAHTGAQIRPSGKKSEWVISKEE